MLEIFFFFVQPFFSYLQLLKVINFSFYRPYSVPLGFICGYPVGSSGEQYGGSMFMRSAANYTLQGKAIQSINERWGNDFRCWNGRETIGIPVCKKKYAPFECRLTNDESGKVGVVVTRAYGCHLHSHLRKRVIQKHGERKGWEPFGQWSLRKATKMAKKEIERINDQINMSKTCTFQANVSNDDNNSLKHICRQGQCRWKMKEKYDDVFSEIHNSESE